MARSAAVISMVRPNDDPAVHDLTWDEKVDAWAAKLKALRPDAMFTAFEFAPDQSKPGVRGRVGYFADPPSDSFVEGLMYRLNRDLLPDTPDAN
jgi:hypothetical protein